MSEKKISEKYPPLSPKDVEEEKKGQEKAKIDFTQEQVEMEKNLTEYLSITDPLMYKEKAIAQIRRPSMRELKELIPPDMRNYVNNPSEVPEEKVENYEKFFYKKMAEMITFPKYTAEEWEGIANPWFIRLFWEHIANIAKLMEGNIEGF